MKPLIISPFMGNIDPLIVAKQKKVIEKLAPDMLLVQAKTVYPHGHTLDTMLTSALNAGFDTALLLDIDAIPLSTHAIESTLLTAYKGILVGNIQRSNHIQNNQHVFVAPSFMGINIKQWDQAGRPSFMETFRGDVAEEVTYRYEQLGYPIQYYMPHRFDSAPLEAPHWNLSDGMPVYGCCTTFGRDGIDYSFHAFQISHKKNVDQFIAKCDEVLGA
jgi:hypothetical protein